MWEVSCDGRFRRAGDLPRSPINVLDRVGRRCDAVQVNPMERTADRFGRHPENPSRSDRLGGPSCLPITNGRHACRQNPRGDPGADGPHQGGRPSAPAPAGSSLQPCLCWSSPWLVDARHAAAAAPARAIEGRAAAYDRPAVPGRRAIRLGPLHRLPGLRRVPSGRGRAAFPLRARHDAEPAGRLALARRLDGKTVTDPELPSVTWSFRYGDGHCTSRGGADNKVEECIAEYAFGSGHHATTFVNCIDPAIPAILEHRLTYLRAATVRWTSLPAMRCKPPPPGLTPHGGVPPPRDARSCFGCHATQVSARDDQVSTRRR